NRQFVNHEHVRPAKFVNSYSFHFFPPRIRSARSESRLQEYLLHVASRNAPAEAEKTEKLSGASGPSAKVITSANKSRSKPLRKAATRVNAPRTSAMPSSVSAKVAAQARAGIVADGMNQLSFAVYAMKCEKSPQATPAFPNDPQKPNRSPTAERKEAPSASRKNTEPKSSIRFNKPFPSCSAITWFEVASAHSTA